MRRIALLFVAVVALLGALLAWRLHAQEEAARGPAGGSGEIEGTEVTLSSRVSARVVEQPVKRGESVRKGDLVVRLDCADQEAAVAEVEARLGAARAQAVAAAASVESSRRAREAALAGQLAAKAQAAALAAQRDVARRQAARLEELASDVAASRRDETRAGAEGLAHQARAAEAQASASADQARVAAAAIQGSGAQAAAAEALVRAAEASLRRARLLEGECRVEAPRDGLVDELPHEPGDLVPAGGALARLVDLSEVKATFYLPNAELAAARPGLAATVVADAWPGERFPGVVRAVSAEAAFTPRNIQTRSDRDRLVYPVEVSVANPGGKLRPGMPVQVELAPLPGRPAGEGSSR